MDIHFFIFGLKLGHRKKQICFSINGGGAFYLFIANFFATQINGGAK